MAAFGVRSLFTAALLALPVAACSGADNQDLFADQAPQNDTSSSNPAPSSPAKTPADQPSSAPATGTAGTPAAPAADPTPAPTPPDQPAKCTQEIEPNNDLAHPTPFTASFCGKIDSANDVDYGSFVVPKGATSIALRHAENNGTVSYRYFMDGVPMLGPDGVLMAVPGATYTVQIKATQNGGGARPTYELDVSFK